jgi:uncharacterized protein (TIGR02588 family)
MSGRDEPHRDGPAGEDSAKKRLEAIAAAIGAVIALATLGVIVWDGVAKQGGHARIRVEAGDVEPYPGGYIVAVTARNEGDETAAAVTVLGEIRSGDDVLETSEITFDYVPSRSGRRGGMFFSRDPAAFELELRAVGYSDP